MTRQQCMRAVLILAALAMLLAGILRLSTHPIAAVLSVLGAFALLLYSIGSFNEPSWPENSN